MACARRTARGRSCTGSTSPSPRERYSRSSARTAPERRPPSRSSRAIAAVTRARCACSAPIRRRPTAPIAPGSGSCSSPPPSTRRCSVHEIVELFAGYYPAPREPGGVIELVGLAQQRDQRVRTLSGGQLRRLDLALALVGDPELIFLDEPTTGFDPAARRQAWDTIRGLRELGKTILLTTHYLEEAQTLADRLAILRDGRIVSVGTPRELLAGDGLVEIRYRRDGQEIVRRDERADARPERADRRGARARRAARGPRSAAPLARGRLPGADRVTLFLRELQTQQRLYWRSREAAFFTFLLPIIFLVLLGSVYGDEDIDGIPGSTFLLAGLLGYGVVATAFAGLAITLVIRRESGVLKRVRGTPLADVDLPRRGDRLDARRARDPRRVANPRRASISWTRPGRRRLSSWPSCCSSAPRSSPRSASRSPGSSAAPKARRPW